MLPGMIPGGAIVSQGGGYQIARSLRFRQATNYLTRTPTVAGNRRKYTFSAWLKRGTDCSGWATGLLYTILGCSTTRSRCHIYNDNLNIVECGGTLTSGPVFRDPAAWFHLVFAADIDNATAALRMRAYINGNEITTWATDQRSSMSGDSDFNAAAIQYIGVSSAIGTYWQGYMADVYWIDGQALPPTAFGAFDPVTNVWNPIAYTGSFGTNGYHLTFADNSAATAAALGKDYSGNGNNQTPTNCSVTPGITNDCMVDTPTPYGTDPGGVGGVMGGNYAVLDPRTFSGVTFEMGNLRFSNSSTSIGRSAVSTIPINADIPKVYCEMTASSVSAQWPIFGVVTMTQHPVPLTNNSGPGYGVAAGDCSYQANGCMYVNNVQVDAPGVWPSMAANDVVMMAFDRATSRLWFGKNGTWFTAGGAPGNPAAGTNPTKTLTIQDCYVAVGSAFSTNADVNFGQRPFAYAAPAGFKSLCNTNMPTPPILRPAKHFDVNARAGTGAAYTKSGLLFKPDLTWTKNRSAASNYYLQSIMAGGFGASKSMSSNLTSVTGTGAAPTLQSMNPTADGFTLAANDTDFNANANNFVDWLWNFGGNPVQNTDGTIGGHWVATNPAAGMSIGNYAGNGVNATVGHGLGVTPYLIIVKPYTAAGNWAVFHILGQPSGASVGLLNSSSGFAANSAYWQNTGPNSTVFSVGTHADVNAAGVAYQFIAFAIVPGFSMFYSYPPNGSAEGAFVYCGFRPRYVLIKRQDTGAAEGWCANDSARYPWNVHDGILQVWSTPAENVGGFYIDLLSSGFKLRNPSNFGNIGGANYIFAAFAEAPFKYARAR